MAFQKATRKQIKLKLALCGQSGGGKTYSALRLAGGMGSKIALIDTENGSASLYSDRFNFDTMDIHPPFTHDKFIQGVKDAVEAGYDVLIIDSASHFWEGILEYKSKLDARGGNSYTNWSDAGNKFKGILDAILQSDIHIICCLRSKMDYVLETNDRGKQVPKKVGLAPIMRDGIQYEFTTVWDIDAAHQASVSKDRTGLFQDKIELITEDHGKRLIEWLSTGAKPAVADPPTVGGRNPDIARPVAAKWTDEQKTEAGGYRAEMEKFPGGKESFSKLWAGMKQDPPSMVIDALAAELNRLREINQEGAN